MTNWIPSLASILDDMVGSKLQEIAVGKLAISLDFLPLDPTKPCLFRLKTTSFVSTVPLAGGEYGAQIEVVLPKLYRQIENALEVIEFNGVRGILKFSGGEVFIIEDLDNMWDNTFSIEVRNFDQPADFLF